MECPFCSSVNLKVLDKRTSNDAIRRRRACEKCKKRFTTYERIETDLTVLKKDNRRESFNREKLKAGILRACEKRPVSMEKVEAMLNKIEAELKSKDKAEIPSKLIGDLVMKNLKSTDKVAYIRFASVYREFADIDDFRKELRSIKR